MFVVCTESVEKKCGYNGRWEGQNGTSGEDSAHGWANYTTCFTPEMLKLHGKVYTNDIEGNVSVERLDRRNLDGPSFLFPRQLQLGVDPLRGCLLRCIAADLLLGISIQHARLTIAGMNVS